jgi:uncharacterized membrane protein YbhN (UPF0104 family)
MRRHIFTVLRSAVAIALLVWLGTSGSIDWGSLRGLAAAWPLTLAALAVFVVDLVVTAWRLTLLMAPRGLHITLRDSVRLSLLGNMFNICLPAGGGDVVRMYYAAEGAVGRRTEVATVMLIDRMIGALGMLVLPLLLAPFFPTLMAGSPLLRALLATGAVVAAGVIAAFAIALSSRARESALLRAILVRFPLGGHPARILDTVHGYRNDVGLLVASLGVSMLAHLLSAVVIMILLYATSTAHVPASITLLATLGFVANSTPLTPGGIGIGEAAFDTLFAVVGVDGGAEAMIGWRILMILLVPAGLALYLRGARGLVRLAGGEAR